MADLNIATVMSLSGRVGLVTGGGTGIGFMIAKAFAENVAKNEPVTGVSGSIVPIHMDVTDEESVKAGAKDVEEIDGRLDILVNNAGFAASLRDPDFASKKDAAEDPFEPETVQKWTDIFALNTIAPFFIVRTFQSLLVKGASSRPQGTSSVINITSVLVNMNSSVSMISFAYSVTEAALDELTLVLATSFAGRGIPIRVNALQPGIFASEIMTPELLEVPKTQGLPGHIAPIPAERGGSEAEMGITALYLAASDYTNGAVLSVDGGLSLVNP